MTWLPFIDTPETLIYTTHSFGCSAAHGAIAQLGERMTGSHEVGGSIPPGSTKQLTSYSPQPRRFFRPGCPLLRLYGHWRGRVSRKRTEAGKCPLTEAVDEVG